MAHDEKNHFRAKSVLMHLRRGARALTDAEAEVLRLLADGQSDQEIANRRVTALRTVNDQVRKIYEKLGLRDEGRRGSRNAATSIYIQILLTGEDSSRPLDGPEILAPRLPLDLPGTVLRRAGPMEELLGYLGMPEPLGLSASTTTVISGIPGVGKSVLALKSFEEEKLADRFPDGVEYVSVGQDDVDLLSKMSYIGRRFGDGAAPYDSKEWASTSLRSFLSNKVVLIVLDNVWSMEQAITLKFGGDRSHTVITTRNNELASQLEKNRFKANRLELEGFTSDEAKEFLEMELGSINPELATRDLARISEKAFYHPFALNLTVQNIRRGSFEAWVERYDERISELRVPDALLTANNSIEANVGVSTDLLAEEDENYADLFHSLGVFAGNNQIPKDLVLNFWDRIKPGYGAHKLEDLLGRISALGLIALHHDIVLQQDTVNIHDMLHNYCKNRLGSKAVALHNQMLKTLNPEDQPWHTAELIAIPYFQEHLHHHFLGANRPKRDWAKLITNASRWMERHPTDSHAVLENFVVGVWKGWNGSFKAKNGPNDAKDYLVKKWIPSHYLRESLPTGLIKTLVAKKLAQFRKAEQPGHSPMLIAVRCAAEERYVDGFVEALCHSDKQIRAAALKYLYFLTHDNAQDGADDGTKFACTVLDLLGKRVTSWGLPLFVALRPVIPASIIIALNQHGRGTEGTAAELRVLRTLSEVIEKVTAKSMLRIVPSRVRALLARILVWTWSIRFRQILKDAQNYSPNNFEGFRAHFQRPSVSREKFRSFLNYFNRKYGSADVFHESALSILLEEGALSSDRLTAILVEIIIVCRGISDPAQLKEIVQQIADSDKGDNLARFSAAFILHAVMMNPQLPADQMGEGLPTMREIVKSWLECSQHGYGRVQDSRGSYQVYPLGYYAALWTKVNEFDPVDLIGDYAKDATKRGDEKLKEHIAATFGDFRHPLRSYPAALTILEEYVKTYKPNTNLGCSLVESLGSLWSLNREDVRTLLVRCDASSELEHAIEAESYRKPLPQAFTRSYLILVDIYLHAGHEHLERLIGIFDSVLAAPDLGKALGILGDQLIHFIVEIRPEVDARIKQIEADQPEASTV